MDKRTIYVIVAVVVVLAILGYALGWFGGAAVGHNRTSPGNSASRDRSDASNTHSGSGTSSACAVDAAPLALGRDSTGPAHPTLIGTASARRMGRSPGTRPRFVAWCA